MAGKRTYHNIASGWLKEGPKGQYISASVNNKMKLTVETENGQRLDVTNFAVFFTENKSTPNQPDVRFTFSTEE